MSKTPGPPGRIVADPGLVVSPKSGGCVVAVPVTDTVCGLPPALSAMDTEAVRVPAAVGVNVTLMVQLALIATLVPQVFVWVKSPAFAPVIEIPEIFKAALPVSDSMTG